jgi:hypothetical protein
LLTSSLDDRYDLPPSQIAKPLPVTTVSKRRASQSKSQENPGKSDLKRKRADSGKNDAPRAFKRLMAFAGGKKPRSGLDEAGAKSTKKPAKPADDTQETESIPTIRPGERMSDFSARVDAALPLGGLVSKTVKNGKDPLGLKVRRTKKEKKMHKLYDEWREEDRRIKERREEELEEAEEREMDMEEVVGVKWKLDTDGQLASKSKKKKKGKRGKYVGEVTGNEEDPWEEIRKKRGEAKIGLNDVAHAPPQLQPPKPKFTVRDGAAVHVGDIPKAAGSLRRREELQSVREDVVASYRTMMEKKRASQVRK